MDFSTIIQHVAYAWPFLAWFMISTLVSEVFERIFENRMGAPVWFMYPRRVQGLFPMVVGGLLGYFVFPDPIPYKIGAAGSSLLFATSGVLGTLAFDPLRDWVKAKYGVEITLPGDSVYPPPPVDCPLVECPAKNEASLMRK